MFAVSTGLIESTKSHVYKDSHYNILFLHEFGEDIQKPFIPGDITTSKKISRFWSNYSNQGDLMLILKSK